MITRSEVNKLSKQLNDILTILSNIKQDEFGNPMFLKTDLNKFTKKAHDIKKQIRVKKYGK